MVTNDLIIVSSGYTPIKPIYAIKPGASGDITLKEDQTTSPAIRWSNMQDGPYIPHAAGLRRSPLRVQSSRRALLL